MRSHLLSALTTLALLVAACSAVPTRVVPSAEPLRVAPQPATQAGNPLPAGGDPTRVDQQGAVGIEVTPLNLGAQADDLAFEVSMNTHSVDLSMDLASLATLSTDTGLNVQATLWDGPRGGHHIRGRLDFPANKDGKSILAGASKLILTILNVDAPSRTFEWDLK